MTIEKRLYPRVNIVCKISAIFADRLLVFNTHTENVGEGGIRVILEERLNLSTMVDIELFLLDKELPIRCKGQVMWTAEIKPEKIKHRIFYTGIKFTELSDHNKEEIRKLVEDVLVEERAYKDFLVSGQ